MKTVNPYFLHELLAPITGLADDDEVDEIYGSLDPNDEGQVKGIIRRDLKPFFDFRLSGRAQERAKTALRYYLSKSGVQWNRVFDSCLPPFSSPDEPRNFFLWLWEEFFPGEDYVLDEGADQYVVAKNIHEPNRYRWLDDERSRF